MIIFCPLEIQIKVQLSLFWHVKVKGLLFLLFSILFRVDVSILSCQELVRMWDNLKWKTLEGASHSLALRASSGGLNTRNIRIMIKRKRWAMWIQWPHNATGVKGLIFPLFTLGLNEEQLFCSLWNEYLAQAGCGKLSERAEHLGVFDMMRIPSGRYISYPANHHLNVLNHPEFFFLKSHGIKLLLESLQ